VKDIEKFSSDGLQSGLHGTRSAAASANEVVNEMKVTNFMMEDAT
jgi:hypothetical protein